MRHLYMTKLTSLDLDVHGETLREILPILILPMVPPPDPCGTILSTRPPSLVDNLQNLALSQGDSHLPAKSIIAFYKQCCHVKNLELNLWFLPHWFWYALGLPDRPELEHMEAEEEVEFTDVGPLLPSLEVVWVIGRSLKKLKAFGYDLQSEDMEVIRGAVGEVVV